MKIAVFVSGSGTNLQNILDKIDVGILESIEVVTIIADRPCVGMERGLSLDIPTYQFDRSPSLSREIDEVLTDEVDLIVLAGFLSILSGEFCEKWDGKMINIHPSLLPKFGGVGMYGAKVLEAVLAAGEKESGATVHFVTEEVDAGAIILQGTYLVEAGDSVKDLQRKVAEVEFDIYPKALSKIKQERNL